MLFYTRGVVQITGVLFINNIDILTYFNVYNIRNFESSLKNKTDSTFINTMFTPKGINKMQQIVEVS